MINIPGGFSQEFWSIIVIIPEFQAWFHGIPGGIGVVPLDSKDP